LTRRRLPQCPEEAYSDGAQSLTIEAFQKMMNDLRPYLELWKESRSVAVAV